VDPVPDPLLLRKSGSAGNLTRTSGRVARNNRDGRIILIIIIDGGGGGGVTIKPSLIRLQLRRIEI
jgi:hypothetical protein